MLVDDEHRLSAVVHRVVAHAAQEKFLRGAGGAGGHKGRGAGSEAQRRQRGQRRQPGGSIACIPGASPALPVFPALPASCPRPQQNLASDWPCGACPALPRPTCLQYGLRVAQVPASLPNKVKRDIHGLCYAATLPLKTGLDEH